MSSQVTAPPPLLNPYTPLAFLPPDLASQFEVSRYLYAVTLGGYLWDCAINIGNDYQLLFKHNIRYPTIIYYLSRIATLTHILTSFVFAVGHIPDCQALLLVLGICLVLSYSLTALLFLFRVVAVWNRNKLVVALFSLLWLGVLGGALTVPIGIKGAHLGPTQACINTQIPEYTEAIGIASMINDSAVFLAITYRILVNSLLEKNLSAQFKAFFGQGFLPNLSKNLLQSGQHYYLIALSGNIVLFVLLKLPHLPTFYRGMCSVPVIAVINSMACIVYRKIKFGVISPDGTSNYQSFGLGSLHFHAASSRQSAINTPLPMHIRRNGNPTASGPLVTLHASSTRLDVPVKGGVQVHIAEDGDSHYEPKPGQI